MQEAREAFAAKLQATQEEHTAQVTALNTRYDETSKELNGKIAAGTERIETLTKAYSDLRDRKSLIEARLNALRAQYGLTGELDDFSTREKMDDLEHQYKMFKRLFKHEWAKTKRRIRREVFEKIFGDEKEREEARARAKGKTPPPPAEPVDVLELTDTQTQETRETPEQTDKDQEQA